MALANFDLQGDAIRIMSSEVFLLSGAAIFREEDVLRVEVPFLMSFRGLLLGFFGRGVDDIGRGVAIGEDAFGGVVAFLGEDGPCPRTNLVQLGANLVLDFVELGQTCLELRSHSIKIYKAFHRKWGREEKKGINGMMISGGQ